MAGRLDALGLEYSFFDAVIGKDLDLETLPAYDGPRRRLLFGRDMSKGELGCLLSHRGVCQEIADRSIDKAIILEDDTILSPDFPAVVQALLKMPVKWDMIRFLDNEKLNKKSRTIGALWGEYKLIRPAINSGGGHAYMVTKEAAQCLVRHTQKNFLPIDILHSYVWLTGLEVFSVKPFPAVRDIVPASTIGETRFDKTSQLSGWQRMAYPLTRSWLKLSEHIGRRRAYWGAWRRDLDNRQRLGSIKS